MGFRPLLNQIYFHLWWLCLDMASIIVSLHTCYNLVEVLPIEFLWRVSICESNIFMLKYQILWWIFTVACLRFFVKVDMASQTLYLSEMNLRHCCTRSFFDHNGTYTYCALKWDWRCSTMTWPKTIFKSL